MKAARVPDSMYKASSTPALEPRRNSAAQGLVGIPLQTTKEGHKTQPPWRQ